MHWPYDWQVHILGILGIAVFYTIRFVQMPPKALLDYSRLSLLIFFLLHYTFRVYHLPYGYVFTVLTQLSLLIVIIFYVRDVLFLRKEFEEIDDGQTVISSRKKAIAYLFYSVAAFGTVIGVIFKILHWEFGFINGGVLLIIGLLAATISVLIDFKKS